MLSKLDKYRIISITEGKLHKSKRFNQKKYFEGFLHNVRYITKN